MSELARVAQLTEQHAASILDFVGWNMPLALAAAEVQLEQVG